MAREAGQSVQTYFSLPLAPPTGNKEKYGWLARLTKINAHFKKFTACLQEGLIHEWKPTLGQTKLIHSLSSRPHAILGSVHVSTAKKTFVRWSVVLLDPPELRITSDLFKLESTLSKLELNSNHFGLQRRRTKVLLKTHSLGHPQLNFCSG